MVSQLTTPDGRVSLLMFYQVLGFVGGEASRPFWGKVHAVRLLMRRLTLFAVACGNALAGIIVSYLEKHGHSTVDAYRGVFVAYSCVAAIKIVLSFAMTNFTEVDHPPIPERTSSPEPTRADSERQPLLRGQESSQPATESILDPPTIPEPPPGLPLGRLVTLAAIFSLDSFASSLIPLSFISYYFRKDFGASVQVITRTFSSTALISCFSQLAAGSISKRMGIIGTMVGTHSEADRP